MAISTYDELKTAVADWLHRGDLTSKIPDFIQIGESMLNRRLRTVDMEMQATSSLSTTVRTLALPSGFMEMFSLWITDPWQEIVYVDPVVMNETVSDDDATGTPSLFTVKDEIEFDVVSTSAYTVRMHYLKKYDIATDSTNWLLTNYPNAYLAAAITAAQVYVIDDARLPLMKQLLENEITEINRQEARKRGSTLAELRVDQSLQAVASPNILNG